MVCAIANDHGGDQHMKQKDGLHCSVRRNSVVTYDEENSTPTGIFVAEQPVGATVCEQTVGWKYPTPDVSQVEITSLNNTELNFLEVYLPRNSHLWTTVASHNLLQSHDSIE